MGFLEGKTVIVTGGGRAVLEDGTCGSIGYGIVTAFAKEGANIVLNGRREISEELISSIEAFGVKCIGVSGDISDFKNAGEMIKTTEDQLGPINILINNAGITNDKLLLRMTEEDFEQVLKINLTGTFNMTQQVLKKMLKLQ